MTQPKSIRERLMIVELHISQWVAKKEDRKATRAVEKTYHTQSDIGKFQKELVDNKSLKAISQLSTKVRQFHNWNTLPWGENGERLLPVENYFPYLKHMEEYISEFNDEVKKFVEEYPNLKEEARIKLNGLFNEKDYPEVGDILSKFGIRTHSMPIPDVEDVRIDLPPEELDKIRTSVETTVSDRLREAIGDVWKRMQTVLERMIERLSKVDNKFQDTLVENIRDLLNIVPKLNIYNDPKIDEVCGEMRKLLVTPEKLRKDEKLRKKTCKTAEEVLEKMKCFMG